MPRRFNLAVAIATALAVSSAWAQTVETKASVQGIEAQPLAQALDMWARQTGLQVIYGSELIGNRTSPGAPAGADAKQALAQILEGSGLSVRWLNARTASIMSAKPAATWRPMSSRAETQRLRLSQAEATSRSASAAEARSTADGAGAAPSTEVLEEIVVSAQKKLERLRDVPVPVTAVSGDMLVNSNQLRIQDYYTRIPGLTMTPGGVRGTPIIAIRGVTTGGVTNPTVGVTVDDLPYGSSTSLGGGSWIPDIDPSDLARIEVLRGPQGTLYGASSVGGLLKFVTVDPSMEGVSGHLQGGVSSITHGNETDYNVRGAINVPLGDTWAIRASAFTRSDPGFVDNVQTGEEGVNHGDAYGGRVAVLWAPNENFSLRLNAFLQDSETQGSSNVHHLPGLGELEQDALGGTGGFHKKYQVYSATLYADLGRAELTSISGYGINDLSDSIDFTPFFSTFTQDAFGVSGTPLLERNRTEKVSQEIRLTMPLGESTEWLVGAFYTDEDSQYVQDILAVDAATGQTAGSWYHGPFPTTYMEYAAFTDLTFHLSDRFDLQVGARQSRNEQTYASFVDGTPPLYADSVIPEVKSQDSAFTYLVTPRFKLSDDLMVYARLASGYRPGGPNSNSLTLGLPATFAPDKTRNYEVGAKGVVLDGALSFDASIYHIDWDDIQLSLFDPAGRGAYYANAGRARSRGVELSLEARPFSATSLTAWVAWNDAELTEDFPSGAALGSQGDRLPDSARFSGTLSLDQEFPLFANATGFAGASVSYVGDRRGQFAGVGSTSAARQEYPAYAKTDVRAGVRWDTWTVNLFVNNVTDRRVFIEGGIGGILPFAFNYLQPRTQGLLVSKSF